MKPDSKANHLLLDYVAMTEKFGFLDFREFVSPLALACGRRVHGGSTSGRLERHDVPELLVAPEEGTDA